MKELDIPMISRKKKSNHIRFQASSNPEQPKKFINPAFSEPVLQWIYRKKENNWDFPCPCHLPPISASGLPFVFPICFCFSAPTAPCCALPFPLGIVALEELRTLCGEEGGLFSLLLVWPLACLSFSLFLRCSCILRLLSSLWMKFVLPWERGSAQKGEITELFCIIHLPSESTSWKNH